MKFFKNRKLCVAVLTCAFILSVSAVQTTALICGNKDNDDQGLSVGAVQVAVLPSAGAVPLAGGVVKGVAEAKANVSSVKGTVEDVAVDAQGRTVWLLRQDGAPAGSAPVQITVTEQTQIEGGGNIANGDTIYVEYRENKAKSQVPQKRTSLLNPKVPGSQYQTQTVLTAQRVRKETPAPENVFYGEVLEILPGGYGVDGSFHMREITDDPETAQEIVFHYGSETESAMALKDVKVGDRFDVVYNGALTRSLPPQGFAQAVLAHDAPAVVVYN